VQSTFAVRHIEYGDTLVAGYRSLRIRLWPDCRDHCDREIADILANSDHWDAFVVSLHGERAVGFIEVRLRDFAEGTSGSPVAFVEGWFVLLKLRRRGLGRALLGAAESWAVSRGCNELGSDTQTSNHLSIEVHKKLGFQEVERRVCFLKQLGDGSGGF
jgi:aminoglycoside 6'-N-acetyltransferase I